MSKIKNSGFDQYGATPVKQQQFGTAGVEGVKVTWAGLVTLTNTAAAIDCQSSTGQIPVDEPEQRIDGYFGKRRILSYKARSHATTVEFQRVISAAATAAAGVNGETTHIQTHTHLPRPAVSINI